MRIVALTFHDVVPNGNGAAASSDAFYRLHASELEGLLAQLRRLGYQSISSQAFRAWQRNAHALPERTVVLTFDDAHASHFELVTPLLLRYRFLGTFFVTTNHIGQAGYMSWAQLHKLRFLGMEIGSHGVTHRPLTDLSSQELREELATSKRVLEQRLEVPVTALAAPGGFWSAAVTHAAEETGYEAVWISTIGTNGKDTNPMALRRVVVRPRMSMEKIVSMVEGWQPAFWWAANQQVAIRLLKRTLGVYWYEQLKRKLVPNA